MTFDDSIDRDLILQTFFAECREGLDALEKALLVLETGRNRDAIDTAFRAAHTLKGNALSLGFPALAKLAHALEDRLGRLRERSDRPAVSLMLQAVDGLRSLVAAAAEGRDGEVREDLIAQLISTDVQAPVQMAEAEAQQQSSRTLRVDVRKLDRMLDLSGEIAIARGRLRGAAGDAVATREALDDLDRHCRDLQEEILAARALPIGPFLEQQARTVRDAALAQGKQARLEVEGDEVEVDTSVLDALREPLMHLVRNAVAHGIEAPALRQARGKDACGTVLLRAHHEPGCVVLEIADDGNGFDRERIAVKARAMGLIAEPESLSDGQLFDVVFEPGFSTANTVDELAGRGVGMDVVRHNVSRLRGSVSIASKPGQGSTLTLRLPLTLAILDAFFVQAAGETWALPLETVSECIDAPALPPGRFGMVPLRGEALPWLRLSEHFGKPAKGCREGMVVVSNGGRRAGVVVEKLDGEGQAVLKPLGPLMRGARGVAGAALLGSGEVALILDVPALFSSAAGATERT